VINGACLHCSGSNMFIAVAYQCLLLCLLDVTVNLLLCSCFYGYYAQCSVFGLPGCVIDVQNGLKSPSEREERNISALLS
jgi:hypothetical protein